MLYLHRNCIPHTHTNTHLRNQALYICLFQTLKPRPSWLCELMYVWLFSFWSQDRVHLLNFHIKISSSLSPYYSPCVSWLLLTQIQLDQAFFSLIGINLTYIFFINPFYSFSRSIPKLKTTDGYISMLFSITYYLTYIFL